MPLPDLVAGARAFAIKKSAVNADPDRYEYLVDTMKQVFDKPEYKEAVAKAGAPPEFIKYGSAADCAKYAADITAVGEKYKDLLSPRHRLHCRRAAREGAVGRSCSPEHSGLSLNRGVCCGGRATGR